MGLRNAIESAFSFLGTQRQGEQRIAAYIIREHRLGRPLEEILRDAYVTNRCTGEQIERLLERPEVVHAIGDDTTVTARGRIG